MTSDAYAEALETKASLMAERDTLRALSQSLQRDREAERAATATQLGRLKAAQAEINTLRAEVEQLRALATGIEPGEIRGYADENLNLPSLRVRCAALVGHVVTLRRELEAALAEVDRVTAGMRKFTDDRALLARDLEVARAESAEYRRGYAAGVEAANKALALTKPPPPPERSYPCADCGALRTKAEGGTTFTVCDACWDKHVKQSPTSDSP